ncbi:phosphoglycerate dehydrogenase-like enzyme [Salana multivorans]|uniref:Phosphoglycerate dehydrogenase-like enzyme n=1 Tax=Salana multivorans TaxID=120377 RepID=A0A3N2DD98_9MICO|nr:D-2-hydroxyacid dehydrogenase [Salana multivorans]ROR97746.1 phosphoglycerate dehydrogenase-like enzyme [Salana multivorans]
MTEAPLRVVVATPLPDDLCALVREREPRLELVVDQSLLPPKRWAADYEGDPAWSRTPAQQAAFDALLDSADVLYGIPDVRPAALRRAVRANPRLRWVQVMAAGGGAQVKAAGLTAEELRRVAFTTSAGVHAGPLAEFAVFGLLAGAKHLPRLQELKARREWAGRWPMEQISDATVLVLGLGGIGSAVADKLVALGARVYGVAREATAVDGIARVLGPDELPEVIGEVDAIVNTLPGTAATERLLSADLLAAVRPGVTLASVGRGTVIDEDALVDALRDGRVGFAALDVFAVEPLPQDSPLWTLPNVVIAPHTAGNSDHEERLVAELFLDNARRFIDGEPMRNVVDTVEFY